MTNVFHNINQNVLTPFSLFLELNVQEYQKVLWVMVMVLIEALGVLATEGNRTNKCIYVFSSLVGKHHEPQSINAKLFLPIIPIGIVTYAFTLL